MRNALIFAVVGAMVFYAGCVRSLHPLYTEEDLVFEMALVGTWADEEDQDTWTFQKSGEYDYDLTVTEDGSRGKFKAHLVQLGSFLFLDLYPQEPEMENDFYKFHLIAAHTFSRIWLEGDALSLSMLNNEWVKDMIDQGKEKIAHERLEDTIVLTAATADLQQFVVKYAEDDKAFPEPGELIRRK